MGRECILTVCICPELAIYDYYEQHAYTVDVFGVISCVICLHAAKP